MAETTRTPQDPTEGIQLELFGLELLAHPETASLQIQTQLLGIGAMAVAASVEAALSDL